MNSDGSIIAVGHKLYNPGSISGLGAVYVYQYNGTSWEQLGQSIYGAASSEAFGMMVSLSADGKTLAVGTNKYIVRIYHFDGTSWIQQGTDIKGIGSFTGFGTVVSLSPDGATLAIGAAKETVGDISNSGAVYVYRYNGSEWTQIQKLGGETASSYFGCSIAMNNDASRIILGSYNWTDGNMSNMGKAYIYQYSADGNIYELLGNQDMLQGYKGDKGGYFGYSVHMNADGTVVAVGGTYVGQDYNKGYAGAYKYNGASWEPLGQTIFGTNLNDYLGDMVRLNGAGDVMAVTAPGNVGGTNVGAVNIYKYDGTEWILLGNRILGEASGDAGWGFLSIDLNSEGDKIATGFAKSQGGIGRLRMFKYNPGTMSVSEQGDKAFTHYPNPVKDILHFNAAGNNIRSVQIYDMTGKLVFGQDASKLGLADINISRLKAGTYLLKARTDKDTKSFKIIKQ